MDFVLLPGYLIMDRAMLLGIKDRAERSIAPQHRGASSGRSDTNKPRGEAVVTPPGNVAGLDLPQADGG
jgi:hypothetical protein